MLSMLGICLQMIVLPALLPVVFAWRQLPLGCIKLQLYNHHHIRELYLNAGEREWNMENITGKSKHFRECKIMGSTKARVIVTCYFLCINDLD